MQKRNISLKRNSQALRKNMTRQEKKLWYDFLKDFPVHFYRQRVIGNYIVDFYCPAKKIVIELDGSQHFEENAKQADNVRDSVLSGQGINVIRYSNSEVDKNFDAVCQDIFNKVK